MLPGNNSSKISELIIGAKSKIEDLENNNEYGLLEIYEPLN